MPISVSDPRSGDREQIEYAARKVGTSEIRQAVFEAICKGKKKEKSISDLEKILPYTRKRILEEAKKLDNAEVLKQISGGFDPTYGKDQFYCAHAKQILRLASNTKARKNYPTKRNVRSSKNYISVKIPSDKTKVHSITIDDIDSFSKVRKISPMNYVDRKEDDVKNLIKKILKEKGTFKDWGGELSDLFTYVRINGKRLPTAFALKGSGKKGKLTPSGMGKNGDQILRLFRSPAEVFLVQYVGQIDPSVLSQMEKMALARSYYLQKPIYYGVIDGSDTERLFKAYTKTK